MTAIADNPYDIVPYGSYPYSLTRAANLDVADSDVTLEYVMDHNICIVSPETIERKIADIVESPGGFGQRLMISYDHLDDVAGRRESKKRLAQEIMPKLSALGA